MLTYSDGTYVSLELGENPSQLRNISAPGRERVAASDRELLLRLLYGLDDDAADDACLTRLQRRGQVVHKESLDDPAVEARFDALARPWAWLRPPDAAGRRFDKLLAATRRAHARRKIWLRAFGQTPVFPETAVRRAMLSGVGSLRILCIGDDDLVSVPLAMLGHQVTVYDVDDVILIPFLRALAKEWKLDISVEQRDLMLAHPPKRRRFDAVYTDPMSTRECFDLFISRGLAELKRGGRVYCAMHAMALETFLDVQRDMGFGLLERYHDFNHYYEEGFWENFYRSDLMVLEKLPQTTPRYALDEAVDLDLFSGELTNRQHQFCDIRAIDPKRFELEHVERAIACLKEHRLIEVAAEQRNREDRTFSYVAALRHGGYFGLTAFLDDQLVAFDLYPFSAGRDAAIREAMRREIPQSFSVLWHTVARPGTQVGGPMPAEKPAKKKPAKKKR